MDVNGTRFWQVAEPAQWTVRDGVRFDTDRRVLRLAGSAPVPGSLPADAAERAERWIGRPSPAVDRHGGLARFDPAIERVVVVTPGRTAVPIGPETATLGLVTDLAFDRDDLLWIAVGGALQSYDPRQRYPSVRLGDPGRRVFRICPARAAGLWALSTRGPDQSLLRVRGLPLPVLLEPGEVPAETFRPDPENPDPPRVATVTALPAGFDAVGVGEAIDGRPLVLGRAGGVGQLLVGLATDDRGAVTGFARRLTLRGITHPATFAVDVDGSITVHEAHREAAVRFELDDDTVEAVESTGSWLPLLDPAPGPFVQALDRAPHYLRADGSVAALVGLGAPRLRATGLATATTRIAAVDDAARAAVRPIDGGRPGIVWHRLYVEAAVPAGTRIRIELAASETAEPPAEDGWFPHDVGVARGEVVADVPRAAWVDADSELPCADPFLRCPRVPDRSGLFTVLVQRPGRAVRRVVGRYLWLRVRLSGCANRSPELAAVRAYGGRFSYRDRYLPTPYRESVFGQAADEKDTPATGPDFLERMLGNFEGILTGFEDRAASAHRYTDPWSCPAGFLPWLASWTGVAFDPALPVERQRAWLAAAPHLRATHGTLAGLWLALEIATGKQASLGGVVVVEDHLLRRTFATILGAHLEGWDDPLFDGATSRANSYVGDSLVLGGGTALAGEHGTELLALFRAEQLDRAERSQVRAFFEDLAWSVTVLVHADLDPRDEGLCRRITERHAPAHVRVRVVRSSDALRVAVRSLVGVDTWLDEPVPGDLAVVGRTRVGFRDIVRHSGALDPRDHYRGLRTVATGPPVAVADDVRVAHGESFTLDASRSRPIPGVPLVEFRWRLLEPE